MSSLAATMRGEIKCKALNRSSAISWSLQDSIYTPTLAVMGSIHCATTADGKPSAPSASGRCLIVRSEHHFEHDADLKYPS